MKKGIKLNFSDIEKKQKETNQWDHLIEAVMERRVIPVIGPNFLVAPENDETPYDSTIDLHKLLLNLLADSFGIEEELHSFSHLLYHPKFNSIVSDKNLIYSFIKESLDQMEEQDMLHPNTLLVRLLETKLFPFVITTSFSPVVEKVMEKIWGKGNLRILQYRNDSKRDNTVGIGDIEDEEDFVKPTIYYLFGKASNEPHRYAVTDMDMMEFCKSWLSGGSAVPRILTECLKSKYLIVLGNNYSDWLFRFIWFSIRATPASMRSSLVMHPNIEISLYDFLDQLQTFIESNPEKVITEIERRVNERKIGTDQKKSRYKYKYDVFISYSRSDKDILQKLVTSMQNEGLTAWYDKQDIAYGSEWSVEIKKGIHSSRLFLPILSQNIVKEYLTPHEYREEWRIACEISRKMGGRAYICPLAPQGFDFYKTETKIPDEFQEKNAYFFSPDDNFQDMARRIRKTVDDLKSIEKDYE